MKSGYDLTELNYDTQLVSARKLIDEGEKHTSGLGMCGVEYLGEKQYICLGFSYYAFYFSYIPSQKFFLLKSNPGLQTFMDYG